MEKNSLFFLITSCTESILLIYSKEAEEFQWEDCPAPLLP